MARALAWQARGDRFESGILHKSNTIVLLFSFMLERPDFTSEGDQFVPIAIGTGIFQDGDQNVLAFSFL